MGERLLCKQEVVGSIPSGSTRLQDHKNPRVKAGEGMSNVEEFRFRCANAAGCLTS